MIKLIKNKNFALDHKDAVYDNLFDRITKILNNGFIGREPNKTYLTNIIEQFLIDLLLNNNLENLLLCEPENFKSLISSIRVNYPQFIDSNSDENKILKYIFITHGYENITFEKLEFIKKINIDSCPYCNRNYIYYLSKSSKIKPEIDHFYPKSIYPFLGLSFFNLIPSCQTCNGFGGKESADPEDKDLVNPYLIEYNDFKFTYKIKSINFINPLLDKSSIELKFLHQLDGNVEVFKLDKLYNLHNDHALELIIKSQIAYSKKYREYLESYTGFNFNENEIERMILGNYSKQEEAHKRPLAKLYQDIGKELGLIK